ncbi:MAG: hypothetical protein IKN96_03745 [Oscillibacter sp.]|nr:hypothetical protein [Oscillibacter sp.]
MSLLFITPYVRYYLDKKVVFSRLWQWALFFLFSYFMGMYSEGSYFIAIFLGVCTLTLSRFAHDAEKEEISTPPHPYISSQCRGLWIMIAPAVMGYLTLWVIPAEMGKAPKSLIGVVANLRQVSAVFAENLLPFLACPKKRVK